MSRETIGIIGGGQLACFLVAAAHSLGIEAYAVADNLDDPVFRFTECVIKNNNNNKIIDFLKSKNINIITFDYEHIELELLKLLSQNFTLRPTYPAIEIAQDRLLEKNFFKSLNIPTVNFYNIKSFIDILENYKINYPAILKTRFAGYDGKGQIVLHSATDLEIHKNLIINLINNSNKNCIIEEFCEFDCEVSLIAVRSVNGEIIFYPLTQNSHQAGILRESIAPYINQNLQYQAEHYLTKILENLNYIGVLTVEFFVKNNQLIANEMAPRVHNSGHWTIEGSYTSQFENHIRAILDLPLGCANARETAILLNCLGKLPDKHKILSYKKTYFHDYFKLPKPNRKVGHVTFLGDSNHPTLHALRQLIINN